MKKRISILKFTKRFFEISCKDLTLFSTLLSMQIIKRPITSILWNWCPFPLHSHGSTPSKQADILRVYQSQLFAKFTSKLKTDCIWMCYWLAIEKQRIEVQWHLFPSSWCCWWSFFWQTQRCIYESGSATGNLVQVNYFIGFEESISKQKNKTNCKPTSKPIKQMDLDAELPNNLLQIRYKYRSVNQSRMRSFQARSLIQHILNLVSLVTIENQSK